MTAPSLPLRGDGRVSAVAPARAEPFVCVGEIVGAQGVRGAVRIKTFTADPEGVAAYGPVFDDAGTRSFRLHVTEVRPGLVIATLSGVADRDAAEALRGVRLNVPRSALPPADEEEFYQADLIGLSAVQADGSAFGTVKDVHNFGAGDILEIALAQGGTTMLAFTRDAVPIVDIAGGRIVVDPPSEVDAADGEHAA